MNKNLVLFVAAVSCAIGAADTRIFFKDGRKGLVFSQDQKVMFELCRKTNKDEDVKRGCSGLEKEKLYSQTLDIYTRNVQQFYGIVSHHFSGIEGMDALKPELKRLQMLLAKKDGIVADQKTRLDESLKMLLFFEEQLNKADDQILKFLGTRQDQDLTERVQAEEVRVMIEAFYRMAYDPSKHIVFRLVNEKGAFSEAGKACEGGWSTVTSSVLLASAKAAAESTINLDEKGTWVWTNNFIPTQEYKVTKFQDRVTGRQLIDDSNRRYILNGGNYEIETVYANNAMVFLKRAMEDESELPGKVKKDVCVEVREPVEGPAAKTYTAPILCQAPFKFSR